MKKQINIQKTEREQKYFFIYEVKAVKHEGEVVVYERFLNEKDAEEDKNFVLEHMTELYRNAYIMKEIVWC